MANVAKIISSDPAISTVEHGLAGVGKEQAKFAGQSFASDFLESASSQYPGVAIFTSDFTRARETASLFADELRKREIPLYNDGVGLESRLRERFFGEMNGGPDTRYQYVWDVDVKDPNHNEFGVESANSVLERTTKLINELDAMLCQSLSEDNPQMWKCVVVAHGDVLQILQTGFLKHEDASRHRSLPHLETATIRELRLDG
jgi:probable phosphoglycerate mutase